MSLMPWLKKSKIRARFKEPLSSHTTLHVGGTAKIWLEPKDSAELKEIICRLNQEKIPYFVIGKGSNILVADRGFKGAVICLHSAFFSKLQAQGNLVSIGAGLALPRLIRQAKRWGLGGLESLAGIPATVGGTLMMNAGSRQQAIGSLAESVTVMDRKGEIRTLKGKQLKFGYRKSNLDQYVVLEAVLKLIKRQPREIAKNITQYLSRKRRTQDLTAKSAGCIFKNPRHNLTAGQMIEACGLKRRRFGGAQISAKHANYIINRRGAKARDVLYLIDLAQREVQKRFGVHLEPEIKIIN